MLYRSFELLEKKPTNYSKVIAEVTILTPKLPFTTKVTHVIDYIRIYIIGISNM